MLPGDVPALEEDSGRDDDGRGRSGLHHVECVAILKPLVKGI